MLPGFSTICPRQLKGTPKGVISKDKLNDKTLYSTNTTYYLSPIKYMFSWLL